MSTSEHYDVVVIGRSVGGLVTAALLAKRRLRVRVLNGPNEPKHPAPLIGLETTPTLYAVMEELGLVHDIRARLFGPPSPITIALPDRRFDFPASAQERGHILGETFPNSTDALIELFSLIEEVGPQLDSVLDGSTSWPLDGPKAQRNIRKYMDTTPCASLMDHSFNWPEDPAVRSLAHALLAVVYEGHEIPSSLNPSVLRSLWHVSHGIPSFRDGAHGFSELIAQKLLSSGGTIEERRAVSHLEVRRSTVKTVVTTDGGRFTADAVVLDGGDASLCALWEDFDEPESTVSEIFMTLPTGHCPEAMTDPCGWMVGKDGPACSVRVMGHEVSLRWPLALSQPDFERLVPFHGGEKTASEPTSAIDSHRLDPMGLFHRGPRSPIKNLLYVGNAVLPHQGLETECWTAATAADLLTEALSKRWRLSARI